MCVCLPLPSRCFVALTACSGLPGRHPMAPAPCSTPHQRRREQTLHLQRPPLDGLPTRLQEGDDNRLSRRAKSLLERREALQDEQLAQMLALAQVLPPAAISSSARPPGRSAGMQRNGHQPIAMPSQPGRLAGGHPGRNNKMGSPGCPFSRSRNCPLKRGSSAGLVSSAPLSMRFVPFHQNEVHQFVAGDTEHLNPFDEQSLLGLEPKQQKSRGWRALDYLAKRPLPRRNGLSQRASSRATTSATASKVPTLVGKQLAGTGFVLDQHQRYLGTTVAGCGRGEPLLER